MSTPSKKVSIIGAGALGSNLLPLLVERDLSLHLHLIDGDQVEGPELVRQPLYADENIGEFKVEVAARAMAEHGLRVDVCPVFLDTGNALGLLTGSDLVIDLSDDAHARRIVDNTCGELRLPLLSAAAHGQQSQVFVLHQKQQLGLKDLFPGTIGPLQDGCDMRNVPLEMIQEVVVLLADRVQQILEGNNDLEGDIDLYDQRDRQWTRFTTPGGTTPVALISG